MSIDYVYLAGPITGLSYGNAADWRAYATEQFSCSPHIVPLSPLRAKIYLQGEQSIAKSYNHIPLSSDKGITTRDRFDTRRSSVILMNLLGAETVTIGTMIEAGWADAYRKPVVLVMEAENLHNHPMLREIAGYVVPSLDEAIDLVRALLTRN